MGYGFGVQLGLPGPGLHPALRSYILSMAASKPKILILDDEENNLSAIQRTLRTHFEIHCCLNPVEALEIIKKNDFAVVVSDQKMPTMSGTEFLSRVATVRPLATRIILTAYTETQQMLDAINRAEIYRYVTKPWDNAELVTVMLKAAEYHALRARNEELLNSLESKNQRLLQKEKELTQLNQKLETQVDERTRELKLANEKLSELALTDSLTNVANRRAFFARFAEEVERSRRYNRPLSFAMIDVDHFKPFNDMEGHVFGDEALKKVARIFSSNIRKTDVVGRYGGEEFCLLMPETPLDVAKDICDRLRSLIEMTDFQGKNGAAYLTVSMGISGFPEGGKEMKQLVESADQALYSAKDAGRNRVECYQGYGTFLSR